MNVSAINQVNFKGTWERDKTVVETENEQGKKVYINGYTLIYHPFKDETAAQIRRTINEASADYPRSKFVGETFVTFELDTKPGSRLDITEAEYMQQRAERMKKIKK